MNFKVISYNWRVKAELASDFDMDFGGVGEHTIQKYFFVNLILR